MDSKIILTVLETLLMMKSSKINSKLKKKPRLRMLLRLLNNGWTPIKTRRLRSIVPSKKHWKICLILL
jgi:hypothetical protein